MNDATASRPAAYAQIRVREPGGERTFGERMTIGGEGADIVVPGVTAAALAIERRKGEWVAIPQPDATVRFDGHQLAAARELRRNDVLAVGEALVSITDASRTLLKLAVHHLVGNATIAPVGEVAVLNLEGGDEDLEIRARPLGAVVQPAIVAPADHSAVADTPRRSEFRLSSRQWAMAIAVAVALLILAMWAFAMEAVSLDIQPRDARVDTPGTWLSLRAGDRMLMLPGTHLVRAKR